MTAGSSNRKNRQDLTDAEAGRPQNTPKFQAQWRLAAFLAEVVFDAPEAEAKAAAFDGFCWSSGPTDDGGYVTDYSLPCQANDGCGNLVRIVRAHFSSTHELLHWDFVADEGNENDPAILQIQENWRLLRERVAKAIPIPNAFLKAFSED